MARNISFAVDGDVADKFRAYCMQRACSMRHVLEEFMLSCIGGGEVVKGYKTDKEYLELGYKQPKLNPEPLVKVRHKVTGKEHETLKSKYEGLPEGKKSEYELVGEA